MKISVICPSRLSKNPTSFDNNLWLDRALMSVRRQTVFPGGWHAGIADVLLPTKVPPVHEFEFVVGLDRDAPDPPARFSDVKFIRSDGAGQAKAVNAAVAASTGDVLVHAEDDDTGYPRKLELQLPWLDKGYDLVTCNSREIDEQANFIAVNDFPTGWVMRRSLWEQIGGFDESFKWHVDTEWLGRANAAGVKRAHLVNAGRTARDERGWLALIGKHSAIVETDEQEPLVGRLRNPSGGMSTIARDELERARSIEEHQRMFGKFGEIPW